MTTLSRIGGPPTAGMPFSAPPRFRPDIEGLRAVAVLLVVVYHAKLAGINGGYVGVDVFFVISGFVITGQLLGSVGAGHGWSALRRFYARRVRRLLPASVVVVVATVIAARVWTPVLQVRSITTDALFSCFYSLNYRLAWQGTQYLHAGDSISPLQHFWSLGVEEQFYLGWPLLVALAALFGRRHRRVLLAGLLVAVVLLSLYYSVSVTRSSASWAYFSLHTRAWELGLGGLVALTANRLAGLPRRIAAPVSWIGLGAILLAAVVLDDRTAYPGYAAVLPVAGTTVLIAAGCTRGPRMAAAVLAEPVLQGIGRVSYSWYLWHWPMLTIAPLALGHPLAWPRRLEVIAVALLAAVLTYVLVENRMRRLVRRDVHWFRVAVVLSGVVVTTATVVANNVPPVQGSGRAAALVKADLASPDAMNEMRQAIAAATVITAAPSNLRPTLDTAATDLPPSSFNGCHADFDAVEQGPCVFGDVNGTHTVVLFGDSHIEQWLPAIAAAGTHEHWRVVDWTKAACPVAMRTVDNPQLKRTYTECDRWRTQTIDRIRNLHPDLVIAGQSDQVPGNLVSDAAWAQDTVTTLDKLKGSGAKIDIMLDIPVSDRDIPTCISAHLDDVRRCAIPSSRSYVFPRRHTMVAQRVTEAGFDAIEPFGWLCTPSACPVVVGNLLVYRNADHLTAEYSRWLAPMVQPLLKFRA